MSDFLPTQPKQPHHREEGFTPSPDWRGGGEEERQEDDTPSEQTGHMFKDNQNIMPSLRRRKAGSAIQQMGAFLFAVAISLTSYFAVSRYVITAVVVQGRSMAPTLQDGERYFLNRWVFMVREPKRGDLVVIRDAGHHDFAVKRVIGLPNETVSIRNGRVFINDQTLQEPYLIPDTKTFCPSEGLLQINLGEEKYFVLGDNRKNSEDSRYYGALTRDQIIGLLVE